MRKIYLSFLILSGLLISTSAEAQVKIGTNGTVIAPSSLLELESANQGLLLPRMTDTVAINALNPPNGMLIYLTKAPAVGLYVRKVSGWEYITGSLGGNGNFSSLNVSGSVTAGNFTGPLNGNATSAITATTAVNSTNSTIVDDTSTPNPVFPTFVNTTPGNSQLRTSSTRLSFRPNTGILTATGFNGNLVGNVTGNATSATNSTNAANTAITNEVNSSAVHYPTFVNASSGSLPQLVSNSSLRFVPLTGTLTATNFNGTLNGNATSATNVTGVVALANGGTGASTKAAAFDALSPLTTAGDIIYMSPSGSATRLGVGIANTFLRTGATPSWTNINLATADVTGILPATAGGTGVNNAVNLTLANADITLNADGNGSNVTLPASGLLATISSPAFTGIPTAPTAPPSTNTTRLATTEFVTTADNLKANIDNPTFTGIPKTAAPLLTSDDTQIATTAFVKSITGMIKSPGTTPNTPTTSVPANGGELEVTYGVNGAPTTGSVVASPNSPVSPGLIIMWARVNATGEITVRYRNFSGAPITAPNLNITVIH